MRLLTAITTVCALGLLACSSNRELYRDYSVARDHIFADEIQSSAATNAFELIENLRPHWVEGRGIKSLRSRTASNPVVYVDGQRHGDILSLTTIPAHNIVKIQRMNAGDATIRFGVGHPGGAILIAMFY